MIPDEPDVLWHILRLLSVPNLFGARAVCRGWAKSLVCGGASDAAATLAKLTTCTVALVGCAAAAAALNDAFGPLKRVVNVALTCVVLFALASPTAALFADGEFSLFIFYFCTGIYGQFD